MSARLTRWLLALSALPIALPARGDEPKKAEPDKPVQLTAQQDHKRMMELLGIKELRRGPSGNPKAPDAANFDEAKAKQDLQLPDPLICKDGTKVTTADQWWKKRRPEVFWFS